MNLQKYLNENQDPKAVEKVVKKVTQLLTSDEEILYIAVQKRPILNVSPDSLTITNKRVIFCYVKNFGMSMSFDDIAWHNVKDCHFDEGIAGSTFYVKTTSGHTKSIEYLPKVQAASLYRFAQEMEEFVEKLRLKKRIESEQRNNTKTVKYIKEEVAAPKLQLSENTTLTKLKKLKELLDNDLITQSEYDTKKQELLSEM